VSFKEKKVEIKVRYRGEDKVLTFEKDKVKAKDILKALGLSKDYAFVVKNGEIVEENEPITQNDEVRVVNAISGGLI
jgi:sulfur carrier protein